MTDLIGLSNSELEGKNLFSLITKYVEFADIEKLNHFFRKVLTENINEEIQFTINGKVLKAKHSKSHSSENFTVIVLDITEKLADKIKLQENEAYNKILFDDSKIPLVVIDVATNKFVDLNDSALRIYGYSNKNYVLGKTPADVSTPTQYNGEISRLAAEKQIEKALKFGENVFEWRHQNLDGKIWDAEVNLMKFNFRGKEYLQFSLLDITQRKMAQNLLIVSEENYRQLSELAPDAIIVQSNGKFVWVNNSQKM